MKKVTRLLYGEKPWKIIYIYIYVRSSIEHD